MRNGHHAQSSWPAMYVTACACRACCCSCNTDTIDLHHTAICCCLQCRYPAPACWQLQSADASCRHCKQTVCGIANNWFVALQTTDLLHSSWFLVPRSDLLRCSCLLLLSELSARGGLGCSNTADGGDVGGLSGQHPLLLLLLLEDLCPLLLLFFLRHTMNRL